ncbi:acetylornithine deacetylase [Rhizodiscina lignyota]|uniref:Acetylornithine deacetylase n=1 Tax=Rhizodiscina lignyota TaxID=1504668 RepID=A0A9P4M9M1_9PEZI|nr:acetylornithine deacetylase [Rhizodiscina lignyota]
MPLSPELVASIKEAVHENFNNQIQFTQKIIQYGGQRGEEAAVQEEMFNQYTSRGYAPKKFEMDEEVLSKHGGAGKFSPQHSRAPVVVGFHEPKSAGSAGKSLILNGHIDIVPTGPEDMWEDGNPYSAVIDGDWLYGRGGGDMRSGLVANMFALDALRKIGKQPASKLILESVPEEESTGNGTMATHLAGFTADAALIPEPTGEALVRANVGVLWFQVEVRGYPVHVSRMTEGSSAISAAWKIVGALQELEKEINEQKGKIPHFEHMKHPINLNVAKIKGGDWASSVPAWCTIDYRVSLYPGTTAKELADKIESIVQKTSEDDPFLSSSPAKVIWNGFFAEGFVLPPSEAENILQTAYHNVNEGTLPDTTSPAYLDARIFTLYDKIPALVYGPLSESVHGFDERVNIKSIERVTAVIALFIAEWCGLEDVA